MNIEKNILNMLTRLCSIRSTSGTTEEVAAAYKIFAAISEIGYFRENKNNLILHDIAGDSLGRKYITALYKTGKSRKTVILLSHFDVVGVEEFGKLREYAFNPEKYTDMLKNRDINQSAKEDLSSGDWLFGRGVMDMKCGLAIHIELLRYIYNNNMDIDGSILLVTVPDEENSSAGMLSAVEYISSLKEEGYEFEAAINSEPYFEEYYGDRNKYIYTGTIGKLLPFVFCAGVEAHAVQPFSGVSSTMLSSQAALLIDGNTELCDRQGEYVSPPPVCLKQYDIKPLYSVTIPCYSYAYYNYFTLTSTPLQVLDRIRDICTQAFQNVAERIKYNDRGYSSLKHAASSQLDIMPNIMSFRELTDIVVSRGVVLDDIMGRYKDSGKDTRDITAEIVADMLKLIPDIRPVMVIGFAPPYYPHRRCGEKHKDVLDVCSRMTEISEKEYNQELIQRDYFPGLCDLSYLGFENPGDYHDLKCNMPVLDVCYSVPEKALASIDIPGINIGVMGRDAHRNTERLNLPYSTKVTPALILSAISEFLAGGRLINRKD